MKSYNNGFNLKKEVIAELTKLGLPLPKFRFYIESPYQKKRYKNEYVGQELWVIYKGTYNNLILQEDWQSQTQKQHIIDVIKSEILNLNKI